VHSEEARYFLGACNAVLLTSSQEAAEHGESLSTSLGIDLFTFSPSPATEYANAQFTLMHESSKDPSKTPYNPTRGFALLYTSGTTGPPKGALYTCNSLVLGTQSYLDRLSLSTTDTWLHQMPAHWKGGFDFILAAAYTGACLEFCSSVFSPTWF
jgi:acyl-CoA synthetase (AMP-forming)/AMP-acid ligase II